MIVSGRHKPYSGQSGRVMSINTDKMYACSSSITCKMQMQTHRNLNECQDLVMGKNKHVM